MLVYRLCKKRYKDDLSGRGAEIAGGRWNSKGVAMLYTGASRALCTVEIAVHLPLGILPKDYYMLSVFVPDDAKITEVDLHFLRDSWKSFPPGFETQKIGNQFIEENGYLILKAPSAVVPGDFNYLINPRHPDFANVRIVTSELFEFDKRLLK